MKIFFIICPIIFTTLGIIAATKFNITPVNHAILMKEIERIKNGGSEYDVDDETRRVCELLTGKKYSELKRA